MSLLRSFRSLRVIAAVAVIFATVMYVLPAAPPAGASGTYSCPGGWSLSGTRCTRVTTNPPHKRLWIGATFTPAPVTTTTTTTTSSGGGLSNSGGSGSGGTGGTYTPITSCTAPDILTGTGWTATCNAPSTTSVNGGSVTVTLKYACAGGSPSTTRSDTVLLSSYGGSVAAATRAATNADNKLGNAWLSTACGKWVATKSASAINPTTGATCTASATEYSNISQFDANQSATSAAQAIADEKCGALVGNIGLGGSDTATMTRTWSGTVPGASYQACVNGVLTNATGPSYSGTSPQETATAYSYSQAQANIDAAAAAVAMGHQNVLATVAAEAAALGTAAAVACGTTYTPPTTTTTTYTPPTTTTTTYTPPPPITYSCPNGGTLSGTTCTITKTAAPMTGVQMPIAAMLNDVAAVVTSDNTQIQVSLVPLTSTSSGTLETVYAASGRNPTSGCTAFEVQGVFTLQGNGQSCEIAGAGTFRFQLSGANVSATSQSFDISTASATSSTQKVVAQTGTTPTYGYTCPSGETLSGSTCVSTSSTAASSVQTGSTPIYGYVCPSGSTLSGSTCVGNITTAAAWAQTGSYTNTTWGQTGTTPTYTYEQTGWTPTYGYVATGSYYTPTYGYVIVGGGGTYAIRGCVGYNYWGQCIWGTVGYGQNPYVYAYEQTGGYWSTTYTYEQTGWAPTYGYVQTGTTPTYGWVTTVYPTYGYVCPSGSTLSGSSCVSTSYSSASWAQTGSTPTYGYVCPSGSTLSGSTCTTTTTSSATKVQTGTTPTYGLVCPSGSTLSGSTCITTTTNLVSSTTGTTVWYYGFG